MKNSLFPYFVTALVILTALAVGSSSMAPDRDSLDEVGASLIAQNFLRVGSPTQGTSNPDSIRELSYEFESATTIEDFSDGFVERLSRSANPDSAEPVISAGIDYLERYFAQENFADMPQLQSFLQQAQQEGFQKTPSGPYERLVCRDGVEVADDLVRSGAVRITAPESELDAGRRTFFQQLLKQIGESAACELMYALGAPGEQFLDQIESLSEYSGAQDAVPRRFERLVCEFGEADAREILSAGTFDFEGIPSDAELAREEIFETTLAEQGEVRACALMQKLQERSTLYLETSTGSDSGEVLFHPNGEVLNWAAFYKMLAEKQDVSYAKWLENFAMIRSVTGIMLDDEPWFAPYERWFRDSYPEFPHFRAEDPVNPKIVRLLYGGLPEGVSGEQEMVFQLQGDAVLEELDNALRESAPELNTLADVLIHPNGQILSWAMFYKYMQEKAEPGTGIVAPGVEWYVPYEVWFRTQYPDFPPSHPADPALPEVVEALYGGLPEGVTRGQREVTLQGGGLTTLSQELNQLALSGYRGAAPQEYTVPTEEDLQRYVSAYLDASDVDQLLYTAAGQPYVWRDFWNEVVSYEQSQGQFTEASGYREWFLTRFPELSVPDENEFVTVAEAKFFLGGNLPEGSYAVDVDLQLMIESLRNFRNVTLGSLASGTEISLVDEVEVNDAGVPVYTVDPLPQDANEAAEQSAELAASLREYLQVLEEEATYMRDFRELQDNLIFQADMQNLLEGPGDETSVYSTLFDQGVSEEANEYLQFLNFVPVYPDSLDGIQTLMALFAGVETDSETYPAGLESVGLDETEAEGNLADPLWNCSQTEDGVIVDTSPECYVTN